ncbi:MAG TPA: hypothetical protein PL067_11305, partial [Bacteroidales bacterium]|nr:hypothetical protein [Candidatus Fermentibacter daniensis]HPO41290.1 hypothetical protein [Bacteroidales bacterium]
QSLMQHERFACLVAGAITFIDLEFNSIPTPSNIVKLRGFCRPNLFVSDSRTVIFMSKVADPIFISGYTISARE